jgi:hypothetical protein
VISRAFSVKGQAAVEPIAAKDSFLLFLISFVEPQKIYNSKGIE